MLQHHNTASQKPGRVVIIGAGGFVGGAIARKLAQERVAILPITRNDVNLLEKGAGAKLTAMLRADDSVVFVSALAPARNYVMLLQNLRMASEVIQALSARAVGHLAYVSSDSVYADDANPVTERSCCQPPSMHGMMHAARELILRSECKMPVAILRPSLLYGARDPHNGYGPNRFRRLAEKGETITLFGDGEEQRDHVYIDDVAQLVSLVLAHRSFGVLNIATGVSTSFRNVADQVVKLSNKRVEIRGAPRQNPVTHRHFDITDCLKAFPHFSYTALSDGLARAAQESGESRS